MKTLKTCYAVIFITALFLSGCSSSVRYTQEEIKDYPLGVQEKISKGEISPGMTQQQVRYAWGSPSSMKTFEPVDGKSKEEWIYSNTLGYRVRLLFLDGKLSDITEGLLLKSGEQKPKQQENKSK